MMRRIISLRQRPQHLGVSLLAALQLMVVYLSFGFGSFCVDVAHGFHVERSVQHSRSIIAVASHHHHTYKSSSVSSIDTGSGDYDEYDPNDDEMIASSSSSSSCQLSSQTSVVSSSRHINISRRRSTLLMALTALSSVLLTTPTTTEPAHAAAKNNGLPLTTAPVSGLRWADAKIGIPQYESSSSGSSNVEIIPRVGAPVAIDYSMASTIGRFPSIYTTKDKGAPYSWILGDGTTIQGIELAILGSKEENIPPMKRGGIRRVIIPNTLGYNQLIAREKTSSSSNDPSPAGKNKRCVAGNEGSIGPIPPKDAPDGAYQRWYQLYCNPRIPYQPEIVLDIKLYRLQ